MIPTKFQSIWQSCFRGEDFFLEIDQPETRIAYGGHVLLTDRNETSNLSRRPSIDASYQLSVHLVMWFHRKRFLELVQLETRIACGSHVC